MDTHNKGADEFLAELRCVVGKKHVLTTLSAMRRFTRGYRYGKGHALAVVRPGNLLEQWRVLQLCNKAGKVVIPQAANTGLTGGSTPFGGEYDRDVVVLNTMRMKSLHIIDDARQVICLAGVTLDELEKVLRRHGREPHSVIGSSCLGASVVGGIANNSGGSLIHRGPAYTELALFAHVDMAGQLCLTNHLGVELGETAEEVLGRLDSGDFGNADIDRDTQHHASDKDYAAYVRDVDSPSPARFNADSRRLFEASGSAGRVVIFAVRLDTFVAQKNAKVFYIGTNNPDDLTDVRRTMLSSSNDLPIAAEYIHRDAFDIAAKYGKDTFLLIKHLGTERLPRLFAIKSRIDDLAERMPLLPLNFSDRLLQAIGSLFPSHLPERMKEYRDRFEHHLMIKVGDNAIDETRAYLSKRFSQTEAAFFECDAEEAVDAFLHRFATAGAAVRYRAVHAHNVGGIVTLDIALPRNTRQWMETLPPSFDQVIDRRLYYGHFFCHVFHQDYVIRKGVDWISVEHELLSLLDIRGAKYPAEHNVGHLYAAEPAVVDHYRELDPCNCFNPGIGQTSKLMRWKESKNT